MATEPAAKKGILARLGGDKLVDILFPVVPDAKAAAKPKGGESHLDGDLTDARARLARADVVSASSQEVNEHVYDTIFEEVVTAHPTAFTGLLAQMETLQDVITDQATLYAAAAKTSKSGSKAILIAIDKHLDLLGQEKSEFDQETDRRSIETVGKRREEQGRITTKITDIETQINGLRDQQNKLRENDRELADEIRAEEAKIANGREAFTRAVEAVRLKLNSYRDNASRYIKEN